MKKIERLVRLIVIVGIAGVILPFVQEWLWRRERDQVRSQIKQSYLRSASRGEVAVPATNSDAFSCWATCFWSLPRTVRVKTSSGHTFTYLAERTTNSTSPYRFEVVSEMDTNANRILDSSGR